MSTPWYVYPRIKARNEAPADDEIWIEGVETKVSPATTEDLLDKIADALERAIFLRNKYVRVKAELDEVMRELASAQQKFNEAANAQAL